MTRSTLLFTAAAALGLAACANIWGMQELSAGDSGSDAETTPDHVTSGGEDARDSEEDASGDADDAATLKEAAAEAGESDAGDDGAAAMAACMAACPSGCCDTLAHCQGGTAASQCGGGGLACTSCYGMSCPPFSPSMCCTSHQCTCATVCF
jgi:hypothetical protein